VICLYVQHKKNENKKILQFFFKKVLTFKPLDKLSFGHKNACVLHRSQKNNKNTKEKTTDHKRKNGAGRSVTLRLNPD